MFKNRLHGDINFYNRDTKNQIVSLPVAGQTGWNMRQVNAGLVRNRGVEFEIGGDIIRTKDFTWNADFNIAKNVNTLVTLHPEQTQYFLRYDKFNYEFGMYSIEGEPVGVLYTGFDQLFIGMKRLLLRGQMSGRSDDNEETIKKRLDVYHNQTSPLIDWYEREGIRNHIDGLGDLDRIFGDICAVIDAL